MNIGTKVEVRFSKSKRLSGTITRINDDETCDVDLESGEKEKEIPLVLIHNVVDSEKEDAAILSKSEASGINISSSNHSLSIGDRVEAKFRGRGSRYYRGTIRNITGGTYDIAYDDGDRDRKLSAEHIRKLPLGNEVDGSVEEQRGRVSRPRSIARSSADGEKKPAEDSVVADVKETDEVVSLKFLQGGREPPEQSFYNKGQRVMARYRGRGTRWYKGTITECFESKNTYSIHYDDGDRDRNLSAEFIRAIEVPEVLQENTTAAVRDIHTGNLEVALKNSEDGAGSKENKNQATTTSDDAAKVKLVEVAAYASTSQFLVSAPDDVSVIIADAADGDVSFVANSGHIARKESPTIDNTENQQDEKRTADYSSGKGNRLYRGKVVSVKTFHLYEIEYPDSTTDTNIPFGALRLPQGFNESDIKVGTIVNVLSWQDRFAAFL